MGMRGLYTFDGFACAVTQVTKISYYTDTHTLWHIRANTHAHTLTCHRQPFLFVTHIGRINKQDPPLDSTVPHFCEMHQRNISYAKQQINKFIE